MKRKIFLFQLLYYVLTLLIYIGFLFSATRIFRTSNLGAVIAITYGLMFLATPTLVVVLMRFSLLKWYIDPLAAAEVPLFLYIGMIINEMNRSSANFNDAFFDINEKLVADGGQGWIFLAGVFLLGLVATFSPARKRGENCSYRLISKIASLNRRNENG